MTWGKATRYGISLLSSVGVVLVAGSCSSLARVIGGSRVRAFRVVLPSGAGYWTVLDEDLSVVPVADAFLRHLRFGRDGAEPTTRSYAGAIALFLRWCARSGRDWQAGAAHLGLFMTWLAHAGPQVSGVDAGPGAAVLAGPGAVLARGERRINAVLAAVRGMIVHAVTEGTAPGHLMRLLFEVADDADLPAAARGEDGSTGWRVRARHRLREPERPVDRAADADIVAVLRGCCSARDRLIVLLMARAGLRRGEVLGLRRSDVHLLADSRELGCEVVRAHLHVVRRPGNPNGAIAKSRRQRAVPLDFLVVQAFDSYELERMTVPAAASSDFVLVNLFRAPLGAPMRLDAVNDLVTAAAGRAGIGAMHPHQLRHSFASNVLDAGGTLEEAQDLLGHASIVSTRVYAHPDPARLRAAVDSVPSPLAQAGGRS
jgi:site-specific recombinase XerD